MEAATQICISTFLNKTNMTKKKAGARNGHRLSF
jgi:hypothetical protein